MTVIKGISGIRGIVNQGFDDQLTTIYADAFSEIQNPGVILIARDAREHGNGFLKCIASVLNTKNREFHNYDIIPTPTAQFLIHHGNYCGGLVITASHNPIDWNGIKFIDSDGCFLSSGKIKQLNKIAGESNFKLNSIEINKNRSLEGIRKHILHTTNLSVINKSKINKKKYNVAVDAVNGAASIALPEMLRFLGCTVHEINCEPTGMPSRGMEPLNENLNEICTFIKKNNIDIGFATDPDGDRLAIIDNNGNPLGEEYTLPICITSIINEISNINNIVTNLSTSMMSEQLCKKNNITLKRTAVGEINVVEEMKKNNSIIGGEGNGGVILAESHYGRDSLVASSLILNYMTSANMTISDIYNTLPKNFMIKDKLIIKNKSFANIREELINNFKDIIINEDDGIKLIWNSKWVHIRQSNTEPIIRLFVEATEKDEADLLMSEIVSCVSKIINEH